MDITKYKNKKLICLKTGAKAKIINYFDDQNASYVKVNLNVKFNYTTLRVLKTIELEELIKQFKFVKISISTIFRFKKMLVYQFGPYQELMHEHREFLHRY